MVGAVVRLWLGWVVAAVSAGSWIATESQCDRDTSTGRFFRLFPGHVIWHLGMTTGLVNCLVYAALLRADNFGQVSKVTEGQDRAENKPSASGGKSFVRDAQRV